MGKSGREGRERSLRKKNKGVMEGKKREEEKTEGAERKRKLK